MRLIYQLYIIDAKSWVGLLQIERDGAFSIGKGSLSE